MQATHASAVCSDIDLDDESLQLLTDQDSPGDYLDKLLSAGRYPDAARFLARALPHREAVWWACVCAQSGIDGADSDQKTALSVAEAWVFKPTEENRQSALAAAEKARQDNAASWAAMAAFWSGGSIAPPDVANIPAAPHLCSVAVGSAVALASVEPDPMLMDDNYALFFKRGIAIANGENAKQVN